MAKEKLFDQLKALSDKERAELLHSLKEEGVKVTASVKAVKEFVAERIQTKDTSPNARRPRKAGEVFKLTDKALVNTVNTWVRAKKGEDVDAMRAETLAKIKSGETVEFGTFKLAPISE